MRILTLLLSGAALWAQPGPAPAPVMPLSLRKAIEIALAPEGNTRVEIASELIRQAESRALQARAALLPQLEGSLGYQNFTRNLEAFGIRFTTPLPIPGFSFPTLVGPIDNVDMRASLGQSILDLSAIRRYQAARASVSAVKREKDNARTEVTDQVARAYMAALRAEARLEAARANLELAEALRKLALSQKTAGTGTGIEVTRAEVQLANEKQRLLESENERTNAHLRLLRAMNLKLDAALQLTDKLSHSPAEPVSLDQAVKAALDARPDWLAQKECERAASLSYGAVKYERLPTIAAYGDYGTIGTGPGSALPTRTVGLAVKVPLFDGGRRDARRGESLSALRQERIRTHDLREQVELEIRLALDSLRSAESQVSVAAEGLAQAARELEQAERRYRAGVASSIEITDAQARLVRARENRIAALFQHNLAKLDLGTAIGNVERFLP